MKHSIILSIALLAVLNILLIGCDGQTRKEDRDEVVSVKVTIDADCIVHYFKSNASAYITRQRHGYNPGARFFQAASMEPTGKIQCSLKQDIFDSTGQKQVALSDLPESFLNKNLATVLFYSFCAGGNLLETGSMMTGDNIKIEGQWYKSLKPAWPNDVEVTLLQSLDSSRIELVQLDDSQDGLMWLARCYNDRYSRELEERVPRTVDVFDVRDGIASKELMIRFDYKDIRKTASADELN